MIAVLHSLFSRYGIPRQLVSDNRPQFTSEEFHEFTVSNGVKHIRSAPYHPATNAAAERMVQTMKKALRASYDNGLPLEQKLIAFLLCYRTTPHYTTGATPSSLFISRELRTRLDLLSPDIRARVKEKQDAQKAYHDQHSKPRKLEPGQSVWARNFRDGSTSVPATVSDQVGLLSYLVQLRNGELWCRHVDHLRAVSEGQPPPLDSTDIVPEENEEIVLPNSTETRSGVSSDPSISPECRSTNILLNPSDISSANFTTDRILESTEPIASRYPKRIGHPPDRYSTWYLDF